MDRDFEGSDGFLRSITELEQKDAMAFWHRSMLGSSSFSNG